MAGTTSGHLLIADISGYTRYLTSSELEHAQGILASLMELLIDRTLPPLRVAGLEGDAVFSYGIASGALGGQSMVEMIEDSYVAFRRAIEQIVINTTCQCNACANISTLDLKFFVHHGTFSISRLRGNDELLGPAVIEIHRVLKNQVTESTGMSAYTAYTTQAIEALDLTDFAAGLTAHTDSYDGIGEITLWIQDMHPVWEAKRDAVIVDLAADDVLLEVTGEVPVPVGVAWELLLQPEYRAALLHVERQRVDHRHDGRIGDGSVFVCYHGSNRVTTQTVISWRPFEFMITEDTTPIPGAKVLLKVAVQAAAPDSTLVTITCSKARGRWLSRAVCDLVGRRLLRSGLTKGLAAVRSKVASGLDDGTLAVPDRNEEVTAEVAAAIAESLEPPP